MLPSAALRLAREQRHTQRPCCPEHCPGAHLSPSSLADAVQHAAFILKTAPFKPSPVHRRKPRKQTREAESLQLTCHFLLVPRSPPHTEMTLSGDSHPRES